jgi:hypothetical protein
MAKMTAKRMLFKFAPADNRRLCDAEQRVLLACVLLQISALHVLQRHLSKQPDR